MSPTQLGPIIRILIKPYTLSVIARSIAPWIAAPFGLAMTVMVIARRRPSADAAIHGIEVAGTQ